jgi:zinc/manganese transport system substrate-binding protein
LALLLGAGACAADDDAADGGRRIVVTTSILGDVVTRLVGDAAEVEVLMPPGVPPHEFQPSARQIASLRDADALIVNGGGFEEGLEDAIADAGVPTFAALDAVEALGDDPHFFTDPARMVTAARAIAAFLEVPAAVGELEALDAEVEDILSAVPPADRVLVTNHEVFAYFADRYDFDVVGVIIPGGGTSGQPSAGDLDELAAVVREHGVPAVFADASSPDDLARALADEVGGVNVVELFSESLPEGMGYAEMVRTNAERIADALAG